MCSTRQVGLWSSGNSTVVSLLPDGGCDKTRSRVTLQEWNDPLDHDLEAQLIYRHLLGVEATLR
jgi:hypothetical protein